MKTNKIGGQRNEDNSICNYDVDGSCNNCRNKIPCQKDYTVYGGRGALTRALLFFA